MSYIFISSNININGIFRKYVSKIVTNLRFYSQANNLVYHSFMDANRRHETLESETKDNLLLGAMAVDRISAFSYSFSSPNPHGEEGQKYL